MVDSVGDRAVVDALDIASVLGGEGGSGRAGARIASDQRQRRLGPDGAASQAIGGSTEGVRWSPYLRDAQQPPAAEPVSPPETVEQRDIDPEDVLSSDVLRGYAPSAAYEPALKALMERMEPLKFAMLGEAVAFVDRSFVAPDNMDHLGDLAPKQKAALLYDLIELKQQFNAYMNQYGDSVPDGERVGRDLDACIEKLMADADVQQFLSETFTLRAKVYLRHDENSDLMTDLEDAYLIDIVGGNAIDRSLAAGKTFEEAVQDYYSELNTLVDLLPAEFIDQHLDAAHVTFSRIVGEQVVGDGTGVNLDTLMAGPRSRGANPYVEDAASRFAESFVRESGLTGEAATQLRQNLSQDVARDVDGVLRLVRGGMKLEDALASFRDSLSGRKTPVGIDGAAYKAGLMHGVQALAMGAVMVARGLGGSSVWAPEDIAAALGSATQIAGMALEGAAKNLDVAGERFSVFGKEAGSWGESLSTRFSPKALEAAGKILGAAGGLAMAGLGFFQASRSLKAGDRAKGALEIVGGLAGAGSALIGFTEAMLYLTNAMSRAFSGLGLAAPELLAVFGNAAKSGLAAAGLVTGLVASAVGLALGLWDIAQGVKRLDDMEKKLNENLERYIGESVHLEFRPDPSFIW